MQHGNANSEVPGPLHGDFQGADGGGALGWVRVHVIQAGVRQVRSYFAKAVQFLRNLFLLRRRESIEQEARIFTWPGGDLTPCIEFPPPGTPTRGWCCKEADRLYPSMAVQAPIGQLRLAEAAVAALIARKSLRVIEASSI